MSIRWWHILALVVVGYIIGYYWPTLGAMTIGKIKAA